MGERTCDGDCAGCVCHQPDEEEEEEMSLEALAEGRRRMLGDLREFVRLATDVRALLEPREMLEAEVAERSHRIDLMETAGLAATYPADFAAVEEARDDLQVVLDEVNRRIAELTGD